MSRSITIKDIATRIGVSNSTVSAVLSSRASRSVRVSEAMRARILEAAREMRYRPNQVAISLRYQRTNVIGVYSSYGYLNPYVPFTGQILGGLHFGCDEHRKDLLLHGMYQGRSAEEIYTELADGRIDGLILYTSMEDPIAAYLSESSLPVVAVVDAMPGLPSVVADDALGSRLIAAHLKARGHRRIFYRAGLSSLTSADQRRIAFQAAAVEHGLEVIESFPAENHERLADSELEWLTLPRDRRPTAAVCWNDLTAYNLLGHCRQRGLRLPEDLAVVGFDGIPPPSSSPWRLTTIRAPWVEVARTAVGLLVRRMEGEKLPSETCLPVELIVGDTT